MAYKNHKTLNHLKLLSWNACSIKPKKGELMNILHSHQPDIALIQETWLKPHDVFNIPNYSIRRRDRKEGIGGGVMILFKKHLIETPLKAPSTEALEIIGSSFTTANGDLKIWSAYLPPIGHGIQQKDLDAFQSILSTTAILGGDLNAKHSAWGCKSTNQRGRNLHHAEFTFPFTVLPPPSPTHLQTLTTPPIYSIFSSQKTFPHSSYRLPCRKLHPITPQYCSTSHSVTQPLLHFRQ